ncbi:MAG: hypothetical protein HYZ39_04370 [Mycolicibacterium cosmeticum]|nr:hypothetical protein [Mycolicibacterium cosmeticum]
MTSHQSRKNDLNGAVPAETPRLRLKPKGSPLGRADGAWWPHSADLASELPDLLAVLSVRLGRIARVLYNVGEWAEPPRKLVTGGRTVRLDGYLRQPADTIEILGLDGERLILLVIPPGAESHSAHSTMMAVAQPTDVEGRDAADRPAMVAVGT